MSPSEWVGKKVQKTHAARRTDFEGGKKNLGLVRMSPTHRVGRKMDLVKKREKMQECGQGACERRAKGGKVTRADRKRPPNRF